MLFYDRARACTNIARVLLVYEALSLKANSEHDLIGHLTELRTRIVRSAIYVFICAVLGWVFYDRIFLLVCSPVASYLERSGSTFLLTGIAEGFSVKIQVSVLSGLIIALPLVSFEVWGFVSPALTPPERRAARIISPLSVLLFLIGVASAYMVLPAAVNWLVAQNPPQAKFMPSVASTVLFILKMCLGFGLVFQMPIVLMFLGRVGIVSSKMLRSYWRHAVVLIGIVAALVTPSGDALTMTLMCAPMVVLYLLSIGLVRLVEKREISRTS